MVEYLTKKEATGILGRSVAWLDKLISSGEISTVIDPKDRRKRLVLASDIHRIKAERESWSVNAKKENAKRKQYRLPSYQRI